MPTYEYHCSKCKATYELRQGFDAETTHRCEECGKGTAKRVLHAPPVLFKGSGWYVTDSKNKQAAASDSKLTKTAADSPPAETKSESKAEPKKADSTPASTPSTSSSSDTAAAG